MRRFFHYENRRWAALFLLLTTVVLFFVAFNVTSNILKEYDTCTSSQNSGAVLHKTESFQLNVLTAPEPRAELTAGKQARTGAFSTFGVGRLAMLVIVFGMLHGEMGLLGSISCIQSDSVSFISLFLGGHAPPVCLA